MPSIIGGKTIPETVGRNKRIKPEKSRKTITEIIIFEKLWLQTEESTVTLCLENIFQEQALCGQNEKAAVGLKFAICQK